MPHNPALDRYINKQNSFQTCWIRHEGSGTIGYFCHTTDDGGSECKPYTEGTSTCFTRSPSRTREYVLTAYSPSGTQGGSIDYRGVVLNNADITVFQAASTEIVKGQCTRLEWVVGGDVQYSYLNNNLGLVNNNGILDVCPTQTTTYVLTSVGQIGSSNILQLAKKSDGSYLKDDSASVTVFVYNPPEITITPPTSINYGNQATITYSGSYIDTSFVVTPLYSYRNTSVPGASVNLLTGTTVNSSFQTQIPYNDDGPFSVQYTFVATGKGGVETKVINITINIDETPDNLLIPESKDLLKSQDPVITPDPTLTSLKILIEDIDIPIEVSADKPILIDINDQDDWKQVRKTT